MANELEILTENAAGTSWVDLIPGAVSTGYQAQNTNIEANRNGIDASYVRYDSGTDEIVIDPSGPIDVNGVPFSVKSEIRLANPGAGTWYLKVVAGADDTLKSIVTQASMGAWVAAKNGLYDGGERVLNWSILNDGVNVLVGNIIASSFTISGDNTFAGDNSFTGDNTFAGDVNVSQITGLTYGDIGTYVIAAISTLAKAQEALPGSTFPGSVLYRSTAVDTTNSASLNALGGDIFTVSSAQWVSLGLSGTWTLMTRVQRGSSDFNYPLGLLLRTS